MVTPAPAAGRRARRPCIVIRRAEPLHICVGVIDSCESPFENGRSNRLHALAHSALQHDADLQPAEWPAAAISSTSRSDMAGGFSTRPACRPRDPDYRVIVEMIRGPGR